MTGETDPFDLARFVAAQAPVFARVEAELRAGRKTSHWMWFVFPQIAGLGTSPMALRYALASLAEARAYLAHDLLGARLRHCTALVNAVQGHTLRDIFGQPDDMKFRSCMTLFSTATSDNAVFMTAPARICGGVPDPATLAHLSPGKATDPPQAGGGRLSP